MTLYHEPSKPSTFHAVTLGLFEPKVKFEMSHENFQPFHITAAEVGISNKAARPTDSGNSNFVDPSYDYGGGIKNNPLPDVSRFNPLFGTETDEMDDIPRDTPRQQNIVLKLVNDEETTDDDMQPISIRETATLTERLPARPSRPTIRRPESNQTTNDDEEEIDITAPPTTRLVYARTKRSSVSSIDRSSTQESADPEFNAALAALNNMQQPDEVRAKSWYADEIEPDQMI